MKKNTGYILFETLIVSTVLLGVLIFLYIQLSAIKTSYETSFKYNTVTNLYKTRTLANYLEETGYDDLKTALANAEDGYIDITGCTYGGSACSTIRGSISAKTIILARSNLITFKSVLSTTNYSEGLKQFVRKTSGNTAKEYMLIVEYNDKTYASMLMGQNS